MFPKTEVGRIQLEDLWADHDLLTGIEILVVVNVRIVVRAGSEYPMAPRVQIRLDRLALDLFANSVLLPVRVGHVVVIEGEERAAQNDGCHQYGGGQPVQADAAGFECRDLIVLAENAECNQHGYQHADGRRVVDELRRQEEKISEHARHGDIVFHDVAQQLEKRVHVRHQHEADQQQNEVEQEAEQDVCVHYLRQDEQPPLAATTDLRWSQWEAAA